MRSDGEAVGGMQVAGSESGHAVVTPEGPVGADGFEQHRPVLQAIAYRMLGSVSEAEDAVQEAWLRWQRRTEQPASPRAFLATVVTRICLDVLRSARWRREQYVGEWFPEPVLEDGYDDPVRSAELADSLSMAALLLLERLSPLERAVFVQREVFGFEYGEIATTVGRSESACRQLAVRARRHMDAGRPRFEADRQRREDLAAGFFTALREGDVDGLRALLATDVKVMADSGGRAPQWGRGMFGRDAAARTLATTFPWYLRVGGSLEARAVNGQPGAVLRDEAGRVFAALALDVLEDQVQTVRLVLNPDKLRHLGPVADDWQVERDARDARRHGRSVP